MNSIIKLNSNKIKISMEKSRIAEVKSIGRCALLNIGLHYFIPPNSVLSQKEQLFTFFLILSIQCLIHSGVLPCHASMSTPSCT